MTVGVELHDLIVTGPSGAIVTGLSFAVAPGETLAVVGESGSGKSMTAKAMSGLLPAGVTATGRLQLGETSVDLADGPAALAPLRGRRLSLLLQNPFTSLSPVHRCGVQIASALPASQRSAAEVERRLAEVDLPARVARQYPHQLSGGMRQRVALAASLSADPEVLIADEPTTALDVTTQRQVLDLLARIQRDRSMAVLLITHDLGVARERADRISVMYAGRLMEAGDGRDLLQTPRHPYTAGLRDSEPPLDRRVESMPAIPGSVPRTWSITAGCAFASRCEFADERCRTDEPPLVADNGGRQVRCWHPLAADAAAPRARTAAAPEIVTSAPVVLVSGLTKRFAPGQPPALDDVSIVVGAGEAVGVVGESGSGKTTLARCLVGLERADSGAIEWGSASARAARAQVVFQDPTSALNPAMTIGATLAEALRVGGRDRREVPSLLAQVGLPAEYATRRPDGLSGGEQQRVAIARALAPRPQLLICDEPVSSLDVSVQAQILNLLKALQSELGLAMLFITHDLAVVRQVVDRVYVMNRGRVVEHGRIDAMLDNPQDAYTRELFSSVPGRARLECPAVDGCDE